MHVIIVYDMDTTDPNEGQKRLTRIKKICRKYLTHVQKSVFEGNLSGGKLARLEKEIIQVINRSSDSVIIYIIPDGVKIERKFLTNLNDPLSNIL